MAETDKILQHRHCYVCGRTYTGEGRFCGDSCMSSKKAELSKKKRQLMIMFLIAMAVSIGAIWMGA